MVGACKSWRSLPRGMMLASASSIMRVRSSRSLARLSRRSPERSSTGRSGSGRWRSTNRSAEVLRSNNHGTVRSCGARSERVQRLFRRPDFPGQKDRAFRLAFGVQLAALPQYQRLNARLVLARALEDVRLISDQMINEREPRAERVQLLVLDRLAFFLGQAAKHSRTINALLRRAKLS